MVEKSYGWIDNAKIILETCIKVGTVYHPLVRKLILEQLKEIYLENPSYSPNLPENLDFMLDIFKEERCKDIVFLVENIASERPDDLTKCALIR